MPKPEIYVSIDIETDGPAPGVNSMLALGAAAFHSDGRELGTWYGKLLPLPGACQDPKTMEWWGTQPEAWKEVQRLPSTPQAATREFVTWCDRLAETGKLIAVAWPAAFDFAFVNYYCHRFAARNPLGIACLDIRSYANGLFAHDAYYGTPKERVASVVGEKRPGLRPHVAVDDAIEQGLLFMALRTSVA